MPALAFAIGYPVAASAQPALPNLNYFGSAVVFGDFDGDGRDEMVVGEPNYAAGGESGSGAIRVYNSLPGNTSYHRLTQNTPGFPGAPGANGKLGKTLAVGDFDHDGLDDLVVGAPGYASSGDRGAAYVLYGRSTGLQTFNRATAHGPPDADAGAGWSDSHWGFGFSLAVGDFGGDAADDLAIGMPGRTVGGQQNAGAVFIRYGKIDEGTSAVNAQIWTQSSPGVPGNPGSFYLFGYSVAAGDISSTSYKDELAIGIPGHDVSGKYLAGAAMVMVGTDTVLGTAGIQHIHQDWGATHGVAENRDSFGTSVAIGDFDDDSYADLAVGVPDENVDGFDYAGFVNVYFGSSTGLSATRAFSLALNGPQADTLEYNQFFGQTLMIGDFNDNGIDDLAVGAPGDVSVTVYYGTSGGLSNSSYQYWTQAHFPIAERLGRNLAAGDFDEDGIDDLGVGQPDVEGGNVIGMEGTPAGLTRVGGFNVLQ